MGQRVDGDVVTLRGVTKRFDELVAVDRLDLSVRNGEFLALLGPSGCGKTTTLRMIAGFEDPTEGEIAIDGAPVTGVPPHRRQVNTVFQQYALFPHMSVLDNVAYGLKQRGMGKRERHVQGHGGARARAPARAARRPGPNQLSGGQQQRVALARALVLEPKVLLLDEPLGALDQKLRKAMQIELKRLQGDVGITFVFVTHDQEEAMAMADRIAVMNEGRVEQLAVPGELYDEPATPFVADFIGDMSVLEGTLAGDEVRSAPAAGSRSGAGSPRCANGADGARRRAPRGRRAARRRGAAATSRRRSSPRWCSAIACRSSRALGDGQELLLRQGPLAGRRGGRGGPARRPRGDRLPAAGGAADRRGRRRRRSGDDGLDARGGGHVNAESPTDINVLVPAERRRAIERADHPPAGAERIDGRPRRPLPGRLRRHVGVGGGSASSSDGEKKASSLEDKPIEKTLLLANWSDYSDPKDYKSYTKALGPKVTVEGYGSNDELIAKMSAGGSAYDVVVPSASYVPECIQKGLLMPLDHALIPNLKNLEESFTPLAYDKGNKYSITKDYGITSFYYRKDVVKDPPTTIADWFKILPDYEGKNVNFIEGGSETWGMFMLGAGQGRVVHRRGRLRGRAEGRAVGQAGDQDDQLDLHRAPRPGADRHRAGLERRRPARRDRGEEEGHRDRLHRARGRRRVLDGQLDDRRRGEEPGGRARVDQLRAPARDRRPTSGTTSATRCRSSAPRSMSTRRSPRAR